MSIRRICLLFNVIFFATIVNQVDVPDTFVFQLLEEFAIGMGVALLVSLLVFPLFATFDIENRVNYSLSTLQQMHALILQAFLCQDQTSAQVPLARATIVEKMVRKTMDPIQVRLDEARFEPSRCLQRLFNRRRRHIIDLTLQGLFFVKVDLVFGDVRSRRTGRSDQCVDLSRLLARADGQTMPIQCVPFRLRPGTALEPSPTGFVSTSGHCQSHLLVADHRGGVHASTS